MLIVNAHFPLGDKQLNMLVVLCILCTVAAYIWM